MSSITFAHEEVIFEDNYIDYEVITESVDTSHTYMQTSTEYDSGENYEISATDEAGNTTSCTYDVNGNKTSVTDGEENVINYTYDSWGNVTSVSSYDSQNTYTYANSSALSSINHNSFCIFPVYFPYYCLHNKAILTLIF